MLFVMDSSTGKIIDEETRAATTAAQPNACRQACEELRAELQLGVQAAAETVDRITARQRERFFAQMTLRQ